MTSQSDLRKVAVQCVSCGTVYAAEEWPDGSVRPIGQRGGCRCGRPDLHVVEDSSRERGRSTSTG